MTRTFARANGKFVKYFALALVLATAASGGLFGQAGTAFAASGVKAGLLTCLILPDTRANRVLASPVRLRCVFDTPHGHEHYMGKIGIGLAADLARRPETEFRFTVLMVSGDRAIGSHPLAGHFFHRVGSSAGVLVLAGVDSKRISLEPLAVESGSGVGVAARLLYLVLNPSS